MRQSCGIDVAMSSKDIIFSAQKSRTFSRYNCLGIKRDGDNEPTQTTEIQ